MAHWSEQAEKGGRLWQLELAYRVYQLLGMKIMKVILYPVVAGFCLLAPGAVRVSRRYLNLVAEMTKQAPPGPRKILRHIHSFAYSLLEKIAAWGGDIALDRLQIKSADFQLLSDDLSRGQGAFIICSHLGNMELLRAMANLKVKLKIRQFAVTSIVDFSGTARFNQFLKRINPDSMMRLFSANDIGPDTIIDLKERLTGGELVIIAGDRTPARNRSKVLKVPFLGQPAYFPQGAFILATLMDAPTYFMFAVRQRDDDATGPYEFHVHRSRQNLAGSRRERLIKIRQLMEEYVRTLEALCLKHPYQWYNFFDFWTKPKTEHPVERA
jgi:predicted LPLAT superfamily acyltransferase